MIFNTWVFGIFACIVLAVYWTLVPVRLKPAYLVVAGAVFYAYAVPAYLLLIVLLGGLTFGIGRAMLRPGLAEGTRRAYLAAGVVLIVGVLAFFKYTKLFALTVDQIAHRNVVPIPAILVPLAISFFTFEFVHVLVDVYHRKIRELRPLDFAVFTMFFPTLVAGPIKRYQTFAPQVASLGGGSPEELRLHGYRVAIGLAKKYVIADSMTLLTQPLLTPGAPFGPVDYWIGMTAYAAKIYFDFSGYSDIAIGLAGLLGVRIPENFERPYWAPNISQFWRRWHMSLSSWIRDYVFVPLGGSRHGRWMTAVNLFLAMAIAGLWHGAAWTFVLWGLWHGAGLAIHRLWSANVVPHLTLLNCASRGVRALSVVGTLLFVCFGWVLFATSSAANAAQVYWHLLNGR
jgi:alginate O-acetyltransferase complex protein AlgI